MSETHMDFSVSYINIYNFGTKLPKLMKTDSLCQKLAQSCPIIWTCGPRVWDPS